MRCAPSPTVFQRLRRSFSSPPRAIVAGGVLVLVLPALWHGPWLPFCDLLAFVGLDSFPAAQSAGPLHVAVLQFTYVGAYALSRVLLDLGATPATQVVLIYLAQVLLLFGVTQWLLRRVIDRPGVCAAAIAAGVLAFWDGVFIWGGPLAFSLAGVLLALATALSISELEAPRGTARFGVAILAVLAMACHPFAFPFAALLLGLRFVFLRTARVHSVLLLAALALFALVIKRDNLEPASSVSFTQLFGFSFGGIAARARELFTADAEAYGVLFGATPPGVRVFFAAMTVVHLLAFAGAPAVWWLARERPALRFLAALLCVVGAMYFLSLDNTAIGEWPQRLLTFYSVFTFAGGVAFPWFLFQRWRERTGRGPLAAPDWLRVTLPAATLLALLAVQVPLLRMSEGIERNYRALRAEIIESGTSNAFVVFTNVDTIRPFYLRAVQFLLFSDAELVQRGLIFSTEWHMQPRHPTRLVENWFDVGRPRFEAAFGSENGRLTLTLRNCPPLLAPVGLGNHATTFGAIPELARRQLALGVQLLQLGTPREAVPHLMTAAHLQPESAETHNALSVAFIRLGRFTEAAEAAEVAVKLAPRWAPGRINLGTALVSGGKGPEGLRQLEAAAALEPDNATWRVELGTALVRVGRREAAAAQFEAALQLDPQQIVARQELARLRMPPAKKSP